MRVGIRVPCALVGAELPPAEDGGGALRHRRRQAARRGEPGHAVLGARAQALRRPRRPAELAADAPVGTDIREHLKLDDTLFTLKLTPNLAHCLSVYGIAREVSALTGAPLKTPPPSRRCRRCTTRR